MEQRYRELKQHKTSYKPDPTVSSVFFLTPSSAYETPDVKADRRPSIVSILGSLTLPADATDAAFPWHIAFDRDLNIVSVGTSLADRYDDDLVACKVYQLVRILRPTDIAGFDFEDYFKATQTVDFVVKVSTIGVLVGGCR